MSQILYGVGNAVFRNFSDLSSIIATSKLQDLSIDLSGNEEKIQGGDSPYAFAYFPKDKAVKISAQDAIFNLKSVQLSQGGTIATTTSNTFTEIENFEIPSTGTNSFTTKITLGYTSGLVTSGVVVDGFAPATPTITDFTPTNVNTAVTVGKYAVDYTKGEVYFNLGDKAKDITVIYERTSSNSTNTLSVFANSMAKPFKFIHRIPIYDDENNIVANGQLTIYKCRATSSFNLGLKPQTAFAPKFELESMDSGRSDRKIWDWAIETI